VRAPRLKTKAISGLRRGASAGARLGHRVTLAVVLTVGIAAGGAIAAAPAQASAGSVPVVVSDYVGGGQLVARLEQLYGPGKKKGTGIDFDATTKTGAISRVYEWTDDRYAHADSAHPIQLTNYWTVPITIADKPIGVAAVWINPQSDAPELADFTASAALETALANVPADAALVHDGATAAWYGVTGTTATPLVAGRSGVTTPTPVADLALVKPGAAATPASGGSNSGIDLAVVVLVLLVLVIIVTLLLPGWLRRRRGAAASAEETTDVVAPEPEPEPTPEPEPEPVAVAAKPAPTPRPKTAPAAAAKPRTPVSQKPATSKPTGTRPAASRPAASKPTARKPPRPPAED
jgi:membrane peptidoglycan carboxypeptidase